jgi:hypothetical protein
VVVVVVLMHTPPPLENFLRPDENRNVFVKRNHKERKFLLLLGFCFRGASDPDRADTTLSNYEPSNDPIHKKYS